ncbi:hypothetical protein CLAFUW4_12769 [Fulvia fulva]|uniref:Uncharacterized protein n=1 Tax=Passalora fulva TaxID=5499 RepID=A0A9Q8UVC5_PASFU|nr:uncharacterized protein CLAFUR5_12635 [Fulvia fulva]KAK4612147.1 hypothetical protein CLAFUR4_12773 [Fulvia fulva]KAK4612361.1 hypothetical protein CLAFUR0_12779 [Fulvia fulva]UJO23828.1 hypothetical protein CLAFUR5_12635 [Fulvia fulva]WPV21537.1 hypothetical protein CLAFUW4_12769 [Fulvia fulva]WPV36578.1 hypothetical protein CLAFUW7_12776 [Fulvia fulva]
MVILTVPTLFFVKPRLPVSAASALRPQYLSFVKHRPFWIFQLGNIAQSLGVFLPPIWMPSFALLIGLPSHAGPLSVALYTIYLGWVAGRYHISQAILISTIGSLVAVFVF